MGNVKFSGKPRDVNCQIDRLGKMSTVLRVSTHIYGVSEEIDLVTKNGNCTCLQTFSGQEWQFYIATDM